ncbi:MAG: Na+/H+ antiporter NhaA [Actinomycetes bacterium]
MSSQRPSSERPGSQRPSVFPRLARPERTFLADVLRQETVGGALLLGAALAGLVLANSGLSAWYESLKDAVVGPSALHLDLSLQAWASDGLLAIFFFVAGLELKRELVVGSLRKPAQAVLPVVAAVAGMVVPALVYLAVAGGQSSARAGWGVPMATDIAFALAVLAVAGSHLPASLRAFLLTLAVVDDMGAITVIALFYTDTFSVAFFVAALVALAAWWLLQHQRVTSPWLLIPLAVVAWVLMHASGVHATVAGVLLGLLTRVRPDPDEPTSPAEHLEHSVRPWSAGLAVPVFAFLSAGVSLSISSVDDALGDIAAIGVVLGLFVGKFVGVFGGSWLTARYTRAELSDDLSWRDMAGLAMLSGVGFTVSLLIAELAFDQDVTRLDDVKIAILVASVAAAAVAVVVLRLRDRVYRRLEALESSDSGGPEAT